MGRGRKGFHKSRQRSTGLDLLGAAFGLPLFRKAQRAQKRAPQIAIDYDSESESDDESYYEASVTEQSVSSVDDDDAISEAQSYVTDFPVKGFSVKGFSVENSSIQDPSTHDSSFHDSFDGETISTKKALGDLDFAQKLSSSSPSSNLATPLINSRCANPVCCFFCSTIGHLSAAHACSNVFETILYDPTTFVFFRSCFTSVFCNFSNSTATTTAVLPTAICFRARYSICTDPSQPAAEPQNQTPSRASTAWTEDSGPFAQEMDRLQSAIDRKMTALAQQPGNQALRADVRKLQDQLNATLNAAIATKRASKKRSESKVSSKLDVNQVKSNEVVDDTPIKETQPRPGDGSETPTKRDTARDRDEKAMGYRDENPEPIPHRHICSGCGCVRTAQFHEKHPLDPEEKPIINFCEVCIRRKIDRGVMGDLHFCFGCGQARSKSFQDQHSVIPGDPILPNYCGKCLNAVRADEGIIEDSVVGVNSETDTKKKKKNKKSRMPAVEEEDCDSLQAHLHSNPHGEKGQGRSKDKGKGKCKQPEPSSTEEESQCDLSEDESTDSREHHSCSHHHHHCHRERQSLQVPKRRAPAVDSPEPSYCPTRNVGSTERRAQRKSSSQFDEDHCTCGAKTGASREYQAPYVEEGSSAPQSRRGTPSPVVPPASRVRKGEVSKGANEHRDSDKAAKQADERPRSSASAGKAKCNCANHEPAGQWEKNIESDLSADSRKSSLKSSSSSGSKTVRFKQSVDIRTPLSPGSRQGHSSEDNRHTDMEDDDGAGPSRSGNSPLLPHQEAHQPAKFRDETRPYLESDYGRSTGNHPDNFRSTFRGPNSVPRGSPSPGFSQGAFGKSFGSAGREWEGFSNYDDSPMDRNRFGPSFGNSARMNGFTGMPPPRNPFGDGFAETPKSQTSFRTSGFGSFFNKAGKGKAPGGDKRTGFGHRYFPDREGSSSPDERSFYSRQPYSGTTYTAHTDPEYYYCGEDETYFQSDDYAAQDNPYYTPRRRYGTRFFSEQQSYGQAGERAAPFWGSRRARNHWPRPDDLIPEAIIEEVSSVGPASPARSIKLIEYNVLTDSSSGTETSNDTEIEEVTSGDESTTTKRKPLLLKSAADVEKEQDL
ncbi:hypothetical protein QQX98_004268 [Neonectria punicea]|uniref:Zinc-finger domain-containing protein n=1 Tax=Neonectria punicea TaxID=979145 RepID=A0ABR1H9Z6_9HYPO